MTTLKMIIAVVGTLIFLAIFSATAQHQEISLKSCTSQNNTQEVNTANFSCLSTKSSQLSKKG